MKNQIKRLQKIDDVLHSISKQINLTNLYPKNIDSEKERFFKETDYNPQFEYNKLNLDFKDAYKKISKLKFKQTVMDNILKEKAREIYYILKMFENIGNKSFTNYSIKIYGEPTPELLNQSKKLVVSDIGKISKPKRKLSTSHALKEFKRIFKELNINWEINAEEFASKAVVIPSSRKFIIKKDRSFSKKEIKRFVVHEIYTHILRTEFGLRQPYKVFSTGLANYEATEEGLALYKEKRAGVLDKRSMRRYAARVLAVDKALKGSFREVFNFLNEYFGKEKAWDTAVRVKRGIKNTGEKGAFTKDISYLRGFLEVKEFIKNQSGLHLLHYGKINTKQALQIPFIEGLRNPYLILKKHFKKNIQDLSILY